MTPFKIAILKHIAECEASSQISGRKALATLASVVATVGKDDTRQAIRELHNDGLIGLAQQRLKTVVRFTLTDAGRRVIADRAAA